MKATITNNSRTSQGVHSVDGLVFIDAGATREVDVADDYVDRLKKLPFLSLGGKKKGSDDAEFVDGRNADGDTPEMAELRSQFDAAYARLQGEHQTAAGQVEALTGQVKTLTARVNELEAEVKAKNDQIAAFNPGGDGQAAAYAVVDKGRGWWVVTQDGKEVTKSLREDDVKEFDKLSDTDKAAFVDLHKAD